MVDGDVKSVELLSDCDEMLENTKSSLKLIYLMFFGSLWLIFWGIFFLSYDNYGGFIGCSIFGSLLMFKSITNMIYLHYRKYRLIEMHDKLVDSI